MIIIFICAIIYYLLLTTEPSSNTILNCVYWKNLDRSLKRKQNMQRLLKYHEFNNIPKKRISAVDAKTNMHILSDNFTNANKKYSNYEYACLLSHLNAIRQFWNSGKSVALIMEDDMTLEFKPYWNTSLTKYISNAPYNWEILQLIYISKNIIPPHKYSKWMPNQYFSTGAYVINASGASHIMKLYYNDKWNLPVKSQHVADLLIYNLCNTYTSNIPFFMYSDNNSSEIHQTHIPFHIASKRYILEWLNLYNNLTN